MNLNPMTIVSRTTALRHALDYLTSFALTSDQAAEVEIDEKDALTAIRLSIKKNAAIAKNLAVQLAATGRQEWASLDESVAKLTYLADQEAASIVRWFFRGETK